MTISQIPADRDWIRQSFLLTPNRISAADRKNRIFTTASLKFTDTRLGGNFSINNPPQYTRYADLKQAGRLAQNQSMTNNNSIYKTQNHWADGSKGMGRFYSEQIDDNSQLIHMQFGVPTFTGMVSFFTGFYNNQAGVLARSGRLADTTFYWIGRAVGFVASLYALPYIAIGYAFKYLSGTPSSKYYYMKVTMGPYWNRVNTVVNSLAVNLGLAAPVYGFQDPYVAETITGDKGLTQSPNRTTMAGNGDPNGQWGPHDRAVFNQLAPDIYDADGGIDIYSVANRAQRMADVQYQAYKTKLETVGGATGTDTIALMNTYMSEFSVSKSQGSQRKLKEYLTAYHGSPAGKGTSGIGAQDLSTLETIGRSTYTTPPKADPKLPVNGEDKSIWQIVQGWWSHFSKNALADLRDGNQFVTFRVDYSGSVSESFDNSFRESEVASKINGISSSSREAAFSFSDGETGIAPIDAVAGAVKSMAEGFLDSIHVSGMLSLAGAAFVDIPKHWDTSSASFPKASYTIELRSPYGNPMSRFQNLYIPLAMLLAAALPLSTGKQSYTSPFLCNLFCKGRTTIRLGMIESLSITRGVGNIGWTPDGNMLGIDVSLSIADMSSILHAPISPGYSILNPLDGIFDDDTAWTDYLSTLSSLTMGEQIYSTRKAVLNITRKVDWIRSQFSTAAISNNVLSTVPGRLLSAFARPSSIIGSN